MDAIKNKIRWVKESELKVSTTSMIGRNTLIIGYDSSLKFINLTDGTELHKLVVTESSMGVSCVVGHKFYDIFAYAEYTVHSNIFICTFPQIHPIYTLKVQDTNNFRRILNMAFSETEHLIVLTGFPDYSIEVWNWRTRKLLAVQSTDIISDKQYIKCSRSFPLSVSQLAYNIGKYILWEIFIAVDTAKLIKRPIELPGADLGGPFGFTYALDGSTFVINNIGTVWHVYPVSQKITEIIRWERNESENENSKVTNNSDAEDAGEINLEGAIGADIEQPNNQSETILHEDNVNAEYKPTKSNLMLHDDDGNDDENTDSDKIKCVVVYYKGGLLIAGPDGSVQHFKKQLNEWYRVWKFIPKERIIIMHCFNQEHLIAIDKYGNVLQLCNDNDEISFIEINKNERYILFFALINPSADYMITVNKFDQINIIKVASGKRLSSLMKSYISTLAVHPLYPVVAIGNSFGTLSLLSIFNPIKPNFLAEFHLCNFGIIRIEFSQTGNVICVCVESNDIFVIQGEIGTTMIITNHIHLIDFIISLIVCETDETIFISALTNPIIAKRMYSNDFTQITVTKSKPIHMTSCALPKGYKCLRLLNQNNSWRYVAVPFKSFSFDIIEITRDKYYDEFKIDVLKSYATKHQIRHFEMKVYADFMISWSWDGLIILWDKENFDEITIYRAHDPYIGGIESVEVNPFRQYIITHGYSKTMMCTEMLDNTFDVQRYTTIKGILEQTVVKDKFLRKTIGFEPTGINEGKTWIDIKAADKEQQERLLCASERLAILSDLEDLKKKLKVLIDKNEQALDDEKLPIETFNLDKEGSQFLCEISRIECDVEKRRILEEGAECDRITDIIKSITWNRMDVKGKNVRGIFTRLKVENYSLLYPDKVREEELNKIKMRRENERLVALNDVFQPWKPRPVEQVELLLSQKPRFIDDDNNDEEDVEKSGNSSEQSTTELCRKNKYSMSGTSTHQFINPLPMRYNQLEVVFYNQMASANILGYHDALELRRYFNKRFDEMAKSKENEINLTRQRNERLRHIQNELNILEELKNSDIRHNRTIIDPTYEPDEIPESIVRVEPHELSVTPYISPEEQLLLDKAAAEAERLRLERLADDFRERALQKMMDGVLEIRWEDEIKKTPPKPDCILSGKDPKDYTPEDLFAIQEHEDTLKHLYSERERYRNMLHDEQNKIDQIMEDQIQKFNLKVGETLMEKIRVEFAIGCEDLKLLRNQLFNFNRLQFSKKEEILHQEIRTIKSDIENLTRILNNLEDILLVCRSKYEELSTKDRALEKQFKSSFSEFAAQAVVDQAYRVFRRRPKWQMRAIQTSNILQDMARRVNAADVSVNGPPIPEECFTYLHLIDQVDKFSNAPNLMDQNLWQILCKMRRVKIEIEFKVRSMGAQMAEVESAVNAFAREINMKKNKLLGAEQRLDDLMEQMSESLRNRKIQLVMKCGNVEVPLSGHRYDFDNAVLLHVSDVNAINQVIRKAGMKKLKTMENAAVFRRKIIFQEWEHNVLRKKIEEKKETIKYMEKFKITKEVQLWLKWKNNNWTEDLSQKALDRKAEATEATLRAMYNEIIKKINSMDQQIEAKQRSNMKLDKQIKNINFTVAQLNLTRDIAEEEKLSKRKKEKMAALVRRSKLVQQVQQQHGQIVELSAMLELQRLRTYPTLNMQPAYVPE